MVYQRSCKTATHSSDNRCYMNTLPKNYQNWYTGIGNHADRKYGCQFALRAIPDCELLMRNAAFMSGV